MNLKFPGKKLIVSNISSEPLAGTSSTVQVLFAGEDSYYKKGDQVLIFTKNEHPKIKYENIDGLWIMNSDLGVIGKVTQDE